MVLTSLSASVLFVTGNTIVWIIQLEVSPSKCFHWGGKLSSRVLIGRVLSVRFCNAGSSIAVAQSLGYPK